MNDIVIGGLSLVALAFILVYCSGNDAQERASKVPH